MSKLLYRIMLFISPTSTVFSLHTHSSAEHEAIITLAALLAYPTRPCDVLAGAGLGTATGTGVIVAVRTT